MKTMELYLYNEITDEEYTAEVEALTKEEIIAFMKSQNPNMWSIEVHAPCDLNYDEDILDETCLYYIDYANNEIIEIVE